MYRCALIGCGKIGSEFADDEARVGIYSHAGAYRACASTELVSVCDADAGRRERCAARWGVTQVFADYRDLLAHGGHDIVSVCTPDTTHEAVIDAALETPGVKAVLAEKPLAMNTLAAARLAAKARTRGVALVVNYSRRFAPSHRALQQWLADGRIGDIRHVSGHYYGGVVHIATHWFDLARFLAGEITRVQAFPAGGPEDDPSLALRMAFAGGADGFLHPVTGSDFTMFEMDLLGSRGRARITHSGHQFTLFEAKESPYYAGYRSLEPVEGPQGGMRDLLLHAVEHVVAVVRDGVAPWCSADDGVAALRIADAAMSSARNQSIEVSCA